MTRSNMHIILTNGKKMRCVADDSSAPELGRIVEMLILPLLGLDNAAEELKLLKELCVVDEQRINATYRYEINLISKRVSFYEENYDSGNNRFIRGEDITERYEAYLKTIKN